MNTQMTTLNPMIPNLVFAGLPSLPPSLDGDIFTENNYLVELMTAYEEDEQVWVLSNEDGTQCYKTCDEMEEALRLNQVIVHQKWKLITKPRTELEEQAFLEAIQEAKERVDKLIKLRDSTGVQKPRYKILLMYCILFD